MRPSSALLLVCAFLAGCRGTVPSPKSRLIQGISTVILGCRVVLPSGETGAALVTVNLEGESERQTHVYRLPVRGERPSLYEVEPGSYHLSPTRSALGFPRETLAVRVESAVYELPFPRDILRRPAMTVKPGRAFPIGVLEARIQPALPGQEPGIKVRLDESIASRRKITEEIIRGMMDPAVPAQERESAVSWARALQNALVDLAGEVERPPLYKAAP